MKIAPTSLIIGLGGLFLINKSLNKPVSTKSSIKSVEDNPYEEFPKNVNVKINEENIFKYYSKTPIFIKTIPDIFNDLSGNLKDYYDPNSEFGNEKSFILINPDFAIKVWNYAKVLLINYPDKYSGKTAKDANLVNKEILLKFAPDVYWKEGFLPYAYHSIFFYVWVSVGFLVRVAYGMINNLNQDFVPSGIE